MRQDGIRAVSIFLTLRHEHIGHSIVKRLTAEVCRIKEVTRKSARAKAMSLSRRGRNIGLRRYMYAYEFHLRNY